VFVIQLRPERGIDGIKALRWLLKKAQRLGLKAVSVSEEVDSPKCGDISTGEDMAHAGSE
jgi:hypothetical protein